MTVRKVVEDPATRRMIDIQGYPYRHGVDGANDTITNRREQVFIELAKCDELIDELLVDDPDADRCTGMYTLLRGYGDTLREFVGEMT